MKKTKNKRRKITKELTARKIMKDKKEEITKDKKEEITKNKMKKDNER